MKLLQKLLLYLVAKKVALQAYENEFGEVGAIGIGAGMGILGGLISIVIIIIVLATTIPILWPMAVDASGNITAMTGTDSGTTMIQGFWPIILLVVGLGIAVGLVFYALRKFGLMGTG